MLSLEEARLTLRQALDDIPPPVLKKLNGGVLLLPEAKPHPQGKDGELYIQGEYHFEPNGLGRYILIYYGSLLKTAGGLGERHFKDALKHVLHHELIHHIESLSGERGLEREDACNLMRYKGGLS
ncbi:MAG: metallopeptidase family protein [Clostridiales bacterium]|jgi:predicted Zn-dependent protease with MMP-like domain|nr:metallopeptidase family protein [Clostridiales bacterium]